MAAGSQTTGTLILELNQRPLRIRSVLINDQLVAEQDWTLGASGNVITLRYSSSSNTELDIEVIYEI